MARKSTSGGGERGRQNGEKRRKVRREILVEKSVLKKDFQAKVTELESVDETGMKKGFRMGLRERKLVLGLSQRGYTDRSGIPCKGRRISSDNQHRIFFSMLSAFPPFI